ncbi:MAG: malto-oligosyltrehalose trehalohydrolase [Polyangiaceae bacterium]
MTPLLGPRLEPEGVRFGIYVTGVRDAYVRVASGDAPQDVAFDDVGGGYREAFVRGLGPGARYRFGLDGRVVPDPYARFLPDGVHGDAIVPGPARAPSNPRVVVPPDEDVLYELHVGTFTPEGTYEAARAKLPHLRDLGVRTIELMPVNAFAGARGWGYDGVALYAPFAPYGTPDELRAFVDDAHGHGLAVVLDVVYNHFGPSGNYLEAFSADYFAGSDDPARANIWGASPNFASDVMRRLVVDNAAYWIEEFGFDGLRLDAVQAIVDRSDVHVLRELATRARLRFPARLHAEDDRNDPDTVLRLGFDASWTDDFHHQVHASFTHERDGYYGSYEPTAAGVRDVVLGGWLYAGRFCPHTGDVRGKPAGDLPAHAFVNYVQNHDQVGNRAFGDRLSRSATPEALKAATMLLAFLPMTPLLFMGQEWDASTPFLFFSDHETALGDSIREGRRREFGKFVAFADPAARARIPDPQDAATFAASRLDWSELSREPHASTLTWTRELLALRRNDDVLRHASRGSMEARTDGDVLFVTRRHAGRSRVLLVNFGDAVSRISGLAGTVVFASTEEARTLARTSSLPRHGAVLVASS